MKPLGQLWHSLVCGCRRDQDRHLWTGWTGLVFPLMSAAALAWFLIRVIPKPVRATYPCQQAAFPLASAFVVWLLGVKAGLLAWFRNQQRSLRLRAALWTACVACLWGPATWVVSGFVGLILAWVPSDPPNAPIGTAKGIFPGRMTWVRDINSTPWRGTGDWWADDTGINQTAVDRTASRALRGLSGAVSGMDWLIVKTNLSRAVTWANFLADVNVSGTITGLDWLAVKTNLSHAVSGAPNLAGFTSNTPARQESSTPHSSSSLSATLGDDVGTPPTPGASSFAAQVADVTGVSATTSLQVAIPQAMSLVSSPPPSGGAVGVLYSQTLVVSGGTGPYRWSVTTGALPDGLSLSSGGLLSGIPTKAGVFNFTVQATDAAGVSASLPYTMAIAATAGIVVPGSASYPSNGMRRIGKLTLSKNLYGRLYNGLIDPVNGFGYFSTAGGTNINPGWIIKVDLRGPLPVEVGACQCGPNEFNLNCGVLDVANGYGYFGSIGTNRIIKIALGSGTNAPTYIGSTQLDSGETTVQGAVADTANGYAYF
ncbi:MAG: Ig domain-containing protein, partial [Verrucomicrobiae bacterium]|nr:Ig domain-containing protein [Verrucomicrobiae bacterium]